MIYTEGFRERVPQEYYEPAQRCGRIEKVEYDSYQYANAKEPIRKKALVFLPAEYDETSDKDYKVLYLMHGGGGDEEEFLYGQDKKHALIHIIDHLIEDKKMEPIIVVTPTFYYTGAQSIEHDIQEAGRITRHYHQEFRNELVPYVEANYRVKKNRESRVFGGFSMGGVTTWSVMMNCLDLVKHFLPLSGDSWVIEERGGAEKTAETVAELKKQVSENGFDGYDYQIFAATGDEDIAFPALDAQVRAMFDAGWDQDEKHALKYVSWKEGTHWYPYIYEYIYNILPVLF